jgi:hypothetical protein
MATDGYILQTCKLPVTFFPRVNRDYEIDFELEATVCVVTIDELKLDGQGKIERVKVTDVKKSEDACSPFTI